MRKLTEEWYVRDELSEQKSERSQLTVGVDYTIEMASGSFEEQKWYVERIVEVIGEIAMLASQHVLKGAELAIVDVKMVPLRGGSKVETRE